MKPKRVRIGEKHLLNMPRLKKIVMMSGSEVLGYLQRLETSIYENMPIDELVETISLNDAQRYLAELCLLNDRKKSGLEEIIESEEEMRIQDCCQ